MADAISYVITMSAASFPKTYSVQPWTHGVQPANGSTTRTIEVIKIADFDWIDFNTGEVFDRFHKRFLGLLGLRRGGSFDRFYKRLLDSIDFDTGGSFQQLQQWGIDAGNGIDPTLAASPIALWEHLKLPANFLQFIKTFLL
jgi:hypothetical protein